MGCVDLQYSDALTLCGACRPTSADNVSADNVTADSVTVDNVTVDNVTVKLAIIEDAVKQDFSVLLSMGADNLPDPTAEGHKTSVKYKENAQR